LQEQISESVRAVLRNRSQPQGVAASTSTPNSKALRLCLLGRYYWRQRTYESLMKAFKYFEQALAEEPNYAAAHAGLGDSYAFLVFYGEMPPREAMPLAKAQALKALEANPNLPEAYALLGSIATFYEWNWTKAEDFYRRALSLDPGYVEAHQWLGEHLHLMGRVQEAEEHLRQAKKVDMFSMISNAREAEFHFERGENDAALAKYLDVLKMDPYSAATHGRVGRVYEAQRLFEKAIGEYEVAETLSGRQSRFTAELARCYGVWGKRQKAEEILERLLDLRKENYVPAFNIALIYAALGTKDQAFEWLETAYQERSPWLVGIAHDSRLENLRSSPRFENLLETLGLPKQARSSTIIASDSLVSAAP
ncbi:MAG: tetratricopeptide repeat protein, partial [Acidobacteria bacterium]|nr:tetratricopeptide repeat protein [Acidobacteriota bacterium]